MDNVMKQDAEHTYIEWKREKDGVLLGVKYNNDEVIVMKGGKECVKLGNIGVGHSGLVDKVLEKEGFVPLDRIKVNKDLGKLRDFIKKGFWGY